MLAVAIGIFVMGVNSSSTLSVQEIAFTGAGGMKLTGELMTPPGQGPFPSVLLLPGSGPTDRDGNQPPAVKTDLLKQIAERMAKSGIATFRFDKRPVHRYRDQWPKDMEKIPDFFSFDNHVFDVKAAYDAMMAHPATDPNRLGIMGHSEGGLFTSAVSASLAPKAIALVGTAGRTLDHTIRYQIARAIEVQNLDAATAKAVVESNEEAIRMIRDHGKLPAKVHPGLVSLYNPSSVSIMRGYMTVDPVVHIKRYSGPVLVMNGAMDVQILVDTDAKALYLGLLSRGKGTQELFVVPSASHNLKPVKTKNQAGFVGPASQAGLDKLASWFKANLG